MTVTASRDAALAAKFPEPPPAAPATPASPAGRRRPRQPHHRPRLRQPQHRCRPAKAPDQSAERLTARAKGLEFEIPLYKYETLFRKREDLLEPKPEPAAKPAN